jgi:heme oxygenase
MNSALPAPDIMVRLRAATAEAHAHLERDLDLLSPPLSRSRFLALLQRFWGFHVVWEPAVCRHAELAELMTPRLRTDLLRRDLLALGLPAQEIDHLPRSAAAAGLARSLEGALGSLYVLEGSTLGGRLITKALRRCDWLPSGGLTYFDPHGEETGPLWLQFQRRLRAMPPPHSHTAVETAAVETFDLLRRLLTPDQVFADPG